jgi:hypothetical protein
VGLSIVAVWLHKSPIVSGSTAPAVEFTWWLWIRWTRRQASIKLAPRTVHAKFIKIDTNFESASKIRAISIKI